MPSILSDSHGDIMYLSMDDLVRCSSSITICATWCQRGYNNIFSSEYTLSGQFLDGPESGRMDPELDIGPRVFTAESDSHILSGWLYYIDQFSRMCHILRSMWLQYWPAALSESATVAIVPNP